MWNAVTLPSFFFPPKETHPPLPSVAVYHLGLRHKSHQQRHRCHRVSRGHSSTIPARSLETHPPETPSQDPPASNIVLFFKKLRGARGNPVKWQHTPSPVEDWKKSQGERLRVLYFYRLRPVCNDFRKKNTLGLEKSGVVPPMGSSKQCFIFRGFTMVFCSSTLKAVHVWVLAMDFTPKPGPSTSPLLKSRLHKDRVESDGWLRKEPHRIRPIPAGPAGRASFYSSRWSQGFLEDGKRWPVQRDALSSFWLKLSQILGE